MTASLSGTSSVEPVRPPAPVVRGFALLHKSVAYVLAYLGLFGLALGGELDVVSLVLLVVGYAATWRAEGPLIATESWQRRWTVFLIVLLVVQIARGLYGEPYLASALVWSGVLQAARLANRRSAREYLQVALLAFLHLCAATVLSTEIGYGIAFLGFIVVVPWMLALTHLRAEIESQHRARSADPRPTESALTPDDERITLPPGATSGVSDAQLERLLSSRRLVGAPFLLGTAALSLPIFMLTALFFLLFPRVGLGMLAFGGNAGTSVAGFGSEVELGQVGRIRDDPTVIARVTPPEVQGTRATYLDLYMRGTSFDHYDGRRWSRSTREGGRALAHLNDEYPITRAQRATDVPYWIVLDYLDQTVVLLPEHTVALEAAPRMTSGLEAGRDLTLYPGLDLRYDDPDQLGLRYTAWVSSTPARETVQPLGEGELTRYLQVPEGHARLAELAREWTTGAQTDRERAELILAAFHRAPFTYSLEMRDPGERPPLEAFLFDWRSGHCEYYASAMALLLRTQGVPTRNVTGFLGARWNVYGAYYAVRSGDAHAWVEVYLPGEGWVTFDPTPPGRGDVGFAASLLGELRNLADAAIVWWELDVIGFDLRSQRNIARDALRWLRSVRGASPGSRGETDAAPASPRSPAPRALVVALALIALIAAGVSWWRRRAARDREPPIPERVRLVVALYRELEAALAARGRPRPAGRTPLEHVQDLEAGGFAGVDIVRAVTDRYNEARFGRVALSADEIGRLVEAVRRLGSSGDRA